VKDAYSREDLKAACDALGLSARPNWACDPDRRVGRGLYAFPEITGKPPVMIASTPREPKAPKASKASTSASPVGVEVIAKTVASQSVSLVRPSAAVDYLDQTAEALIACAGAAIGDAVPMVDHSFVQDDNFKVLFSIIRSTKFCPVYITGPTGTGKTTATEQACARAKRRYFRVGITAETDEDSLIGGFRLIDGNMVWIPGPVVVAMLTGGVLLLDEVDLGDRLIMALQPVLEGRPVYLKKISRWVQPAPGFTIVATGNTRGEGGNTRYIGTMPLNEAFLDRFPVLLEQKYPEAPLEMKILTKRMQDMDWSSHSSTEEARASIVEGITVWAKNIRALHDTGTLNESMSTRRLIDILKTWAILDCTIHDAVDHCIRRCKPANRQGFHDLFTKIVPVTGMA